MRNIILMLCVVVLIMAGCGQQFVCSDGTTVSDPEMCPEVRELQEKADELEEKAEDLMGVIEIKDGSNPVVKDIDPEIQELFDKVLAYDNYEFTLKTSEDALGYHVEVLDNRIKYSYIDRTINYQKEEVYDTVLLDGDKKQAYQYCMTRSKCDDDQRETIRMVGYDKMMISTLHDVIDSIITAEVIGDERIQNRQAHVIEIKDDTGEWKMWVDQYFGVPLRKERGEGLDLEWVNYESFSKGGVRDADVTVPSDRKII